MKKHNFSAGPCILPPTVLKEASEAVLNWNNSGLSLIEVSHRGKEFVAVMDEARQLVKDLLDVPANYEVLFLQGGASLGFYTTAMNFMKVNGKAAYYDTGTWSSKAIKEAKLVGEVEIIASSKENGYKNIPAPAAAPSDADYVHYTTNNTIFGTQFNYVPESNGTLVCDMSSDIFSRPIDVSKYDLIDAGAQKNMGPAGTVLYIVNKDKLGKSGRTIPAYLDLQVHIDKDSMFNTPPVFAIFTSMLTLRWLKSIGGVSAIEKINNEKARVMYQAIDENPLFVGYADKDSRSNMNATFKLVDDSLAPEFDKMWQEAGISGIKGHRSVGGYRASMYNALTLESVQTLTEVMQKFATINA